MTVTVAMAIPRLTPRFGNAVLLAVGIAVTLAGMAWLSRVEVDSCYVASVGLPMVLIGAGKGLAFAPLTAAGITGVSAGEAGAASGLVNTAHQLGSALGLGILVALSASGGAALGDPADALAAHVSAALSGGTLLLGVGLVLALALIPTSAFASAGPSSKITSRSIPPARIRPACSPWPARTRGCPLRRRSGRRGRHRPGPPRW